MGQLLCLRTKKTAPKGGKTLPSLPEAGQKGEGAGGKKQLVEKANTLSPPAAKKMLFQKAHLRDWGWLSWRSWA